MQGIGGGGIMPLAQTVIADASTPRERGRYQALIGSFWVSAGIAGPLVGGFIAEHLPWSMIFWLNVPLGLLGVATIHSALKKLPRHDRKHRLDLVGAALMMIAAIALLLALAWGGTRYSWASPQIALLLLVLRAVRRAVRLAPAARAGAVPAVADPQGRRGAHGHRRERLRGRRVARAHHLSAALFPGGAQALGRDVRARADPAGGDDDAGIDPVGPGAQPLEHYKRVPIVALSLAIAAAAFLALWPTAPIWLVVAALTVISMGCGATYPVCTVSVQNAVPVHQVGTVTGVMNFFRALMSALEVAILGAIVVAGFGVGMERGRGADAVVQAASALGSGVSHIFGMMFAAAGLFLALGLLALILMEERPLRGPAAP